MSEENNNNTEKYCSSCHRSESEAGKMVTIPGGMNMCVDCLQQTLDEISSSNPFGDMGFPPSFMGLPIGNITISHKVSPVKKDEKGTPENEMIDGAVSEELMPELTGDNPDAPNEPKKEEPPKKKKPVPNVAFVSPGDLGGLFEGLGFGGQKKSQVKRRTPEEKKKDPVIDASKILPPHKLKAKLDEYVIGQEKAKKVISVAVYNHYKRVLAGASLGDNDGVEIEKSNLLLIGPTGSGKTYIVKTLAKMLDVPLAITDATSLTEAGYIGDDIESVLSKLLMAADNDVDRAEVGIVFIDEIDKIAKKNSTRGRDVSGESVQQGLLKLLEGAEVEVPVGSTSKNAMVPLTTMNTQNILFICGGAFPELEEIIKNRVTRNASMGFGAALKADFENDKNIFDKVETEDLREFGMIPEFLGRLPIVCALHELDKEMLVQVLKEPKNAILKQYQKLLELDEVKLEFEDEALLALTERAVKKEAGARGLRSIIEEIMLDIMYEIPKDDSIGKVIITKDYIENNGAPIIELRGSGKNVNLLVDKSAEEVVE